MAKEYDRNSGVPSLEMGDKLSPLLRGFCASIPSIKFVDSKRAADIRE
jgi:hypothetical protein